MTNEPTAKTVDQVAKGMPQQGKKRTRVGEKHAEERKYTVHQTE